MASVLSTKSLLILGATVTVLAGCAKTAVPAPAPTDDAMMKQTEATPDTMMKDVSPSPDVMMKKESDSMMKEPTATPDAMMKSK